MNDVEERVAAAERVWAEGPRKFSAGIVLDAKMKNDAKYPYASLRHMGKPLEKDCKMVPVTKGGFTVMAPLIESKAHEDRLARKHGMVRE